MPLFGAVLFLYDVCRLWSFFADNDFVFYCLAIFQCFVTILNDGGEVYEDLIAVIAANESISFVSAEPFDFTGHL